MTWKSERWLTEVFPGETAIYAEYRDLPPRELAIVSAAVLDVAIAELIARRLAHLANEIETFLGVNGDGRAPASSFGARIQLALLIGILTPDDAAILRTIKEIRNLFAHRVKVDFLSPAAVKITIRLHALWTRRTESLAKSGAISGTSELLSEIGRHISKEADAGETLLLAVFVVYHAYFHRMHNRISRIGSALTKSS